MKIQENFLVKGIFHHDKSYTHIYLVFFRFVELCSARNQMHLLSGYSQFRIYRKITIRYKSNCMPEFQNSWIMIK